MRRGAEVLTLVAVVGLAGCGAPDESPGSVEDPGPSGAALGPLPARAASEAAPARFGLGRPATEAEIVALDIDVMPDGTGLPPGSGTVARGREVWAASCVACHGTEGEGTEAFRGVVYPGDNPLAFVDGSDPNAMAARHVGNYWPYAPTVFDYVRRAMPFDRPGSLSDDDTYAVVAWILWKNTLIPEDAVMDASTLARVLMPARDRFVLDERGTGVRK